METVQLDVLLAVITACGASVTKVVDALRKFVSSELEDRFPRRIKFLWNVTPWFLGVLVALSLNVNVFPSSHGVWGEILTGLAVGASASGWHEVFDSLSGVAKVGHQEALTLKQQRQLS